jgi:hypothetical protein
MSCRYVTPTLYLGTPPPGLRPCCVEVATAAEAWEVITRGCIAVVPWGRYDLADETMKLLGVDAETRAERVFFARTGRLGRASTETAKDSLLDGFP